MKQIHKRVEPDAFRLWREANAERIQQLIDEGKTGNELWSMFLSSLAIEAIENDYSKTQLRQALLKEQSFICCYCNDEIKGSPLGTKVEHFLPKETFLDKTFNYQNLHLACNGGERESPVMLSCDSAKKDKNPNTVGILSPLLENVHEHFRYYLDGRIDGVTEEGRTTITQLNLDCARLRIRRRTVIKEYLDIASIEDILPEEVFEVIDGKLQPFCVAIYQILL